MQKKKNQKRGFSLIELLAVIVILGIISTVTIVSIKYLANKSKENHYDSQLSNLLSTAKLFVGDNESKLPKNIGQKTTVTLEELINNNYIKEIKDYEKESCYNDKSYVNVFKYGKNKYSYYVHLSCPNYESKTESEYNIGPEITINPYEALNKIEFKIKARTFTSLEYSTTNKILSYKYILYTKDKTTNQYIETTNSGDVESGIIENITKEIKLTGPIPSEYKLEITAVDIYGNVSTKSKEVKIEDNTAPICEIIGQAESDNDWTNTERLVTVNCIDNESGCERTTYTKLFTEEAKNGKIVIKDKAGNQTECSFMVNIDKTEPTCTSKTSNSNWTNKTVTLTGECHDTGGSGCKENITKQFSAQGNRAESPGTVYDNAGNSTVCPTKTVKIDTTPPTCTSSGGSTNWTNKNVTLTGTCKDNTDGSGCVSATITKSFSSEGDRAESPGTVSDNAGNSTPCPNQTVKIDKTAPTGLTVTLKKWTNNSTAPTSSNYTSLTNYSSGDWSKLNVYTKASGATDAGGSGVDGYYYTTTGATANATDTKDSDRNIKAEGTSTIKYKVCDKVGNCSAYSSAYRIKIDKTPPTATINKTAGTYKKTTLLKLTCSDDRSGVDSSKIVFNSKTYKDNDSSVSFRFSSAVNNKKATFTCKDNAGNTTTEERRYTVEEDCPEGSTLFGSQRDTTNFTNSYIEAEEETKAFDYNWCYSNNKWCDANEGYTRVCSLQEWCKGKTAKEINEEYGCSYYKYWCTC